MHESFLRPWEGPYWCVYMSTVCTNKIAETKFQPQQQRSLLSLFTSILASLYSLWSSLNRVIKSISEIQLRGSWNWGRFGSYLGRCIYIVYSLLIASCSGIWMASRNALTVLTPPVSMTQKHGARGPVEIHSDVWNT